MTISPHMVTAEELMKRLTKAVGPGGDFPVSAKVVKELMEVGRSATATAHQVSSIVKRDPTLSSRIISVLNGSFYGRSAPIKDLTQAIIQLGMEPLIKIAGSLILLQKFVPLARQKGPFAHALSTSITVAIMHEQLCAFQSKAACKNRTKGDPLLGMLSAMGQLLFSFYYSDIYESARVRAKERQISISQSLVALTGVSSLEMSLYILKSLHLSELYEEVVARTNDMVMDWSFKQFQPSSLNNDASTLAVCVYIADLLHAEITQVQFSTSVRDFPEICSLSDEDFCTIISLIPTYFKDYCSEIELILPPLPDYLNNFKFNYEVVEGISTPQESKFKACLYEVREAMSSGETLISIVSSIMDGLLNALEFSRVVFFTPNSNKTYLEARLALGDTHSFDIRSIRHHVTNENVDLADVAAWVNQRIEVRGKPTFEDAWPLVAFPVGFGAASAGVIYADMSIKEKTSLTDQEVSMIGIFASLLDKATISQKGEL
jgi:HD-like signal output (HDOD) protein